MFYKFFICSTKGFSNLRNYKSNAQNYIGVKVHSTMHVTSMTVATICTYQLFDDLMFVDPCIIV